VVQLVHNAEVEWGSAAHRMQVVIKHGKNVYLHVIAVGYSMEITPVVVV
jgi:hypothetical protein